MVYYRPSEDITNAICDVPQQAATQRTAAAPADGTGAGSEVVGTKQLLAGDAPMHSAGRTSANQSDPGSAARFRTMNRTT